MKPFLHVIGNLSLKFDINYSLEEKKGKLRELTKVR